MKTNDFIEMLERLDPDGEMEVLIGNDDLIVAPTWEPGYYDGKAKIAKFDEDGEVLSVEETSDACKICLSSVDLSDTFIMSIIEDGREYPIEIELGCDVQRWKEWRIERCEKACDVCCNLCESNIKRGDKEWALKYLNLAVLCNEIILKYDGDLVYYDRIKLLSNRLYKKFKFT